MQVIKKLKYDVLIIVTIVLRDNLLLCNGCNKKRQNICHGSLSHCSPALSKKKMK